MASLLGQQARRLARLPAQLRSTLADSVGGTVRMERDGKLARIVLDRPDKNNCLSGQMMLQLGEVIQEACSLDDCSVVVLEGNGTSFCSGADLALIQQLSSASAGNAMFDYMSDCLSSLRLSSLVVVARVQGYCMGGATEIATAADMRLVHRKSKMGFLQARMGIVPSWGGAKYLEDTVGRGHALRLMATAPVIGAEEAERIGWATQVYDTEEELKALLDSLCQFESSVTRAQKEMLNAVKGGQTDGENDVIRSVWGYPAQTAALTKQLDAVVHRNKKN